MGRTSDRGQGEVEKRKDKEREGDGYIRYLEGEGDHNRISYNGNEGGVHTYYLDTYKHYTPDVILSQYQSKINLTLKVKKKKKSSC